MPRNLSLWLLLGLVALIGLLFFQIIRPFIVALFISVVLTVLFAPLHRWLTERLAGRQRIAAGLTTAIVILLVLVPISVTLLMAGSQAMQVGKDTIAWFDDQSDNGFDETVQKWESTEIGGALRHIYDQFPASQQKQLRESVSRFSEGVTAEIYVKTRGLLSDVFTLVISIGVMTLALYYFLADRQLFIAEVHRMLPLENREEQELTDRFQLVCRGVVLGTVVAGLVQAALSGIAYGVIGVPQLWVLIVLTMFFSFIPFLGAGAVWGAVVVYLLVEGRFGSAIGLAIYGTLIVSTADNLVRSYVIGNQARLHPLIALVTVLGALKLMGLWGIFVGPMVAAFFYALLNIARERIRHEYRRRPSWQSHSQRFHENVPSWIRTK